MNTQNKLAPVVAIEVAQKIQQLTQLEQLLVLVDSNAQLVVATSIRGIGNLSVTVPAKAILEALDRYSMDEMDLLKQAEIPQIDEYFMQVRDATKRHREMLTAGRQQAQAGTDPAAVDPYMQTR